MDRSTIKCMKPDSRPGFTKTLILDGLGWQLKVSAMQPIRGLLDEHIRDALKSTLREQDHTGAIIEEMPLLRGRGRADLAFINGKLYSFEIKSEADSLIRLGMQTENYEASGVAPLVQ